MSESSRRLEDRMDRSRRTIRSVEEQFHALFAADVAGAILTHMHELESDRVGPNRSLSQLHSDCRGEPIVN